MMQDIKDIKWAAEQRFQFIEHQAFWRGGLNRSDLTDHFGLSVPQASKDLAAYQSMLPENLIYDASKRRYFRSTKFEAGFINLDADDFLRTMADACGHFCETGGSAIAEALPLPRRTISPAVLQPIAQCAAEGRSIEINYVSMSADTPDAEWRRITPHTFCSDSLRWHVRAFCHRSRVFRDFIISRCLSTRLIDEPGARPEDDRLWNSKFEVVLTPNPMLSDRQRAAIATEYAMNDLTLTVNVRQAMLYYFNKRLRLDAAPSLDGPHEAPLCVLNKAEYDVALAEAIT
jgi:predicted DNA-binding transcriptional regulator YafY